MILPLPSAAAPPPDGSSQFARALLAAAAEVTIAERRLKQQILDAALPREAVP